MNHPEKPFLVAHNNALRAHLAEAGLLEQVEQQIRKCPDFRRHVLKVVDDLQAGQILLFWADEDGFVCLLTGPDVPSVLADWDFFR